MTRVKKLDKNSARLFLKKLQRPKTRNIGMLGLIGTTTLACNASTDDQCYGSLGVVIGSLCASQNDPIVNTELKLNKISSLDDFSLSTLLDANGKQRSDTVEFVNNNNVIGTKHTLTDGDIIKNPGTVFLNLINSGSIDGQDIFNADEIVISSQGTTVVLASEWHNIDQLTIKDSDQSVTINDLQASKLDSAIAEDNMFYPNTSYYIENVDALNQLISFYFNSAAILGTSTEVDLKIKNSLIGIQSGVFTNPNAEAPDQAGAVDPFLVPADTNIEKLNLQIADTEITGSRIQDLIVTGLEILDMSGGTKNYNFEITDPLEASLKEVNATLVPANLILNVSESLLPKNIELGSGDDTLTIGGALVESPAFDTIHGGAGSDTVRIIFDNAITVVPKFSSFEFIDLSANGESILDFSNINDVETFNISESSSAISLTNIPFDLTKFNVTGSQTGAWSVAFEDNAAAMVNLSWSNHTGNNVVLTSLVFDEVQSLSLTSDGANDINLDGLSMDVDDTKLVGFTNIGDGNLIISGGSQLDTFDAVTSVALTATGGGNISLGSLASNFGITSASKLSAVNMVASQTGEVEIGSIGTTTKAEDLQLISITSSGADVSLGSIAAINSGVFSAAISSSAIVTLGDMIFENQGSSFVASGSGSLAPINFTKEAYSSINLSDLGDNVSVNFANANNGVTISLGSGNDTVTVGLGSDIITGNDGADIFIVGNGSSGLSLATADIITDFKSNIDKLKLGVLGDETANTGNYIESNSSVSNYTEARVAANAALNTLNSTSDATELYAFEYDSNSGYLFVDSNSDGVAEDLIILSGIESSLISASDLIA